MRTIAIVLCCFLICSNLRSLAAESILTRKDREIGKNVIGAEHQNAANRSVGISSLAGIRYLSYDFSLLTEAQKSRLANKLKQCGLRVEQQRDSVTRSVPGTHAALIELELDLGLTGDYVLKENPSEDHPVYLRVLQKCTLVRNPASSVTAATYELLEFANSRNLDDKLDKLVDSFVIDVLTANAGTKK